MKEIVVSCVHRSSVLGIAFLLFVLVAMPIPHADADPGYPVDVTIPAYTFEYWHFNLAQEDGVYGKFRITEGNDVYFFITDQEGHDEVQSVGSTDIRFKETTYYSEDGKQHYWNLTVPYSDNWYVYFSKAIWAPTDTTQVRIVGEIRRDTDAPSISIGSAVYGNLTGIVDVTFTVVDTGFPVRAISFTVDGNQMGVKYNPNLTNGLVYQDSFQWDTRTVDNGPHSLTFTAWDTLLHHRELKIAVTVQNPEIIIPMPLLYLIVVAFGALALVSLFRK